MAIQEVLTAPRSPGQNPYTERLVGSIRRECLDHILVLNESSLHLMTERAETTQLEMIPVSINRMARPRTRPTPAAGE